MSNGGYFVISLDLELYWGMFDKVTLDQYGEHIKGSHTAVPALLDTFTKYGIHATWATVGMLMYKNKKSLQANLPNEAAQPTYANKLISSYEHLKHASIGDNEQDDPYHFGASLVQNILQHPGQELASHTFSHYYCIDGVENSEAIFHADCKALQQAAQQYGVSCTSIIFPRNQTNEAALRVCNHNGITTYRGTENHFLYRARKESAQTNPVIRILRLCDHYINLTGYHTYPLKHTVHRTAPEMINVPASRFFRPYSLVLRFGEALRLQRIKKAMTYAAEHNEVFHLWWHPHNFGMHLEENMRNLHDLLEHYKKLQMQYGMQSKNMQEIATLSNELSV